MNFSNSRSYFSSFMRNLSKNKYSNMFLNSSTNSKKSLINFSNNLTHSNFLTLSRMISCVKFSSLINLNCIHANSEENASTLEEKQTTKGLILDINTLLWNDICMIKNCN